MKEWIEGNVWNVLVIAVPVLMAVLILISEIRDIKSKIEYAKEESARKIEYVKEQSKEEIKYVKEEANRKIKYVKEESERKIEKLEKEIEYLQGKVENNRRESDQKWLQTTLKDMGKKEGE